MFKNTASQKLIVYAFDSTTNQPKTGDAANLTAYVSKDDGAVTVLADTSASEKDSTNAKGYYVFSLAQAETNADALLFSAKSSTSNVVVLAMPAVVYTTPANFSTLSIDSDGRIETLNDPVGPGSISYPVTVDDGTNPLDGAEVWVTTDSAGLNVVAGTLSTDAMGLATFLLDAGNYYLWVSHSGYDGTNPTAITVS